MIMETDVQPSTELIPPNPIRVETALSRYPVHRLAKHGDIAIDISEQNEQGEFSIKWEVDYSKKHGQPGPLAYKLDTLIINRRIEDASQPVRSTRRIPKIIKLGGITDICRELGITDSGGNTLRIKASLHQNASTYITPKITYRQSDGSEQTLETGFTRYSVVFTGEKLPNGRKADAVYIILNDIYMQVINGAMTRPLDYDYLKSLPPAPQRFYELLSYQMYATIKNDRPRAKVIYSEFCTYAPQTHHFDWERVRSQMNKIYRPHKQSGYIAKIDYEKTVDDDGQPDWIMLYQPGPKARAEYRAFAKRGGPVMLEAEPFNAAPLPQIAAPQPTLLVAELVKRGVTEATAADLVKQHQAEAIEHQIEILDWLMEKKPAKISEPGAYLVSAIKTGHAAPKGFTTKAQRQAHEEARQAKERQDAEARRQAHEQETRERADREKADAYLKRLTAAERAALEAEAIAQASPDTRQNLESPGMARFRDMLMLGMLREHVAKKLDQQILIDP
jgi:hypothetical protein